MTSHSTLKPSDLFSFFVANFAAPIARSLVAGTMISEYTFGAEIGPSVQELVEGPKLNHTDSSLRCCWMRFSE